MKGNVVDIIRIVLRGLGASGILALVVVPILNIIVVVKILYTLYTQVSQYGFSDFFQSRPEAILLLIAINLLIILHFQISTLLAYFQFAKEIIERSDEITPEDVERNPEVVEDLFPYLRRATVDVIFAFYFVVFLSVPVVELLVSDYGFSMSYRLGLVALTIVNAVSLAIQLYL